MYSPVPLDWIQYTSMKTKNGNRKPSSKRPTLRGKGDYNVDTTSITDPLQRLESKIDHLENKLVGKNTVNSAASKIGRTLGNFVGQGELGALAGSSLARLFGHGDYTIKSNSLMASTVNSAGAVFSKDGHRGTRVTEREFLGNVSSGTLSGSSSVFNLNKFRLNPSAPETFPWLSKYAYLYDQWEPHGIVFEFVSTSSDFNGSSQQLGAVIMATDYDPLDNTYTTKQQMENSYYCCSAKPSMGLLHGIECAIRERPTKLLYTDLENGANPALSSLGNFQVATQGCSAASATLGELWVSYDITFYKKQLVDNPNIPFYQALGTSSPSQGSFTGITSVTSYKITMASNDTSSTIYFNNDEIEASYIIFFRWNYYETQNFLTPGSSVNCVAWTQNSGTTGSPGSCFILVKTTGANATVQFNGKAGSTGTPWYLVSTQVTKKLFP